MRFAGPMIRRGEAGEGEGGGCCGEGGRGGCGFLGKVKLDYQGAWTPESGVLWLWIGPWK